ncbi:MAG: HK97 gp10 family phage protein [Candidatus Nanoarchaeia archaeon]
MPRPELSAKVLRRKLAPTILANIGIAVMQRAKQLCPKWLGKLRDSIHYKVIEDTVYIGTDLEYAYYMEYGRRPGKMPPIENIRKWAKWHGMEGAEWAIAKKIAKEGIKVGTIEHPLETPSGWRPYLRPAVHQMKSEIPRIIRRTIMR